MQSLGEKVCAPVSLYPYVSNDSCASLAVPCKKLPITPILIWYQEKSQGNPHNREKLRETPDKETPGNRTDHLTKRRERKGVAGNGCIRGHINHLGGL